MVPPQVLWDLEALPPGGPEGAPGGRAGAGLRWLAETKGAAEHGGHRP